MNDPNLNAYLQQGSQIGIFNPDYVNQGLIGSVKVKDKRGNEYNKLVINQVKITFLMKLITLNPTHFSLLFTLLV